MKRTFKKTLSLVLAVLMVFAVMPIAGAADHTHVFNQYTTAPDGSGHFSSCSCGAVNYGTFEACSGGAATCAKGALCSKCGNEYTEKSNVHGTPYLNTDEKYLSVAANCKNPAYYYLACMDCNEATSNVIAVGVADPNNHQFTGGTANNNKTHNAACAFCGTVSNNIPCYDSEPVVKGATCTTGGQTENTCEVCGYYWAESIPALGHDYTKESGVRRTAATCTEFDTYWYMCKTCGANAKDDANAQDKYYNGTDKLPHVYDQKVMNEYTIVSSATCLQKAKYYYSCKCGARGTEMFDGESGTHLWDDGIYNNDAKCGVDGTKTVTCKVPGCGATDVVTAPGTALSHVYTREIQSADRIRTAGNCQVANTYWKTCARCDDAWSDTVFFTGTTKGECNADGMTINELNYNLFLKTPATCTTLAVFYKYCTVCGTSSMGKANEATFTFGTTIDHTFIEKIEDQYIRKQATCDEGAVYSKSCAVCGLAKVSADVDIMDPNANVTVADIFYGTKLGHDLKSTKAYKDSTCALEGNYEEFTCQRMLGGKKCGFKTGGETIPKKDHVFKVTHEFRNPTCKTNGQYGQKKCDGCGTIIFFDGNGETVLVPSLNMTATGHEDKDGDLICEKCDSLLEAEDFCKCLCHKGEQGGIMYFIIWILKWFWKMTGSNEICECGAFHY